MNITSLAECWFQELVSIYRRRRRRRERANRNVLSSGRWWHCRFPVNAFAPSFYFCPIHIAQSTSEQPWREYIKEGSLLPMSFHVNCIMNERERGGTLKKIPRPTVVYQTSCCVGESGRHQRNSLLLPENSCKCSRKNWKISEKEQPNKTLRLKNWDGTDSSVLREKSREVQLRARLYI
jgi:hypothetical protein